MGPTPQPTRHRDYEALGVALGVASFLLFLFGGMLAGDIVRGESSSWVWDELNKTHVARSSADLVLNVAWYLAFYSLGFFVPYWLTTLVLFLRRERASTAETTMTLNQRVGRLLLSLSSLILFLLLQESLIAFIRALATEQWNGWMLVFGVASAAFLAYLAFSAFKRPNGSR